MISTESIGADRSDLNEPSALPGVAMLYSDKLVVLVSPHLDAEVFKFQQLLDSIYPGANFELIDPDNVICPASEDIIRRADVLVLEEVRGDRLALAKKLHTLSPHATKIFCNGQKPSIVPAFSDTALDFLEHSGVIWLPRPKDGDVFPKIVLNCPELGRAMV